MKKLLKVFAGLAVVVLVGVLFLVYQYGPNFNIFLFPPSAQKYGEIAISRMENGLYAHGEEWNQTKENALQQMENAEEYEDTYPILEEAIQVAGGDHSFFVYPDEQTNDNPANAFPTATIEENILILNIPAFGSPDMNENQEYADTLNHAIQNETYQGIIVNLANNTGGDMGPMVAGISSLIPDGTVVKFQYSNDLADEAILEDGTITGGGASVTVEPTEKVSDVPVAVVINELTASSGEMTALAFKGLENVQFFGENSLGFTSGNSQMELYDDTIMQLTTATIIDRTGTKYENIPVEPDVHTKTPIEDAKKWINNQ